MSRVAGVGVGTGPAVGAGVSAVRRIRELSAECPCPAVCPDRPALLAEVAAAARLACRVSVQKKKKGSPLQMKKTCSVCDMPMLLAGKKDFH